MNLLFGEILDVALEDGMQQGTVRIGGVRKKVVLDFISNPARGDRVLLCDGVAVSRVEPQPESDHVPGHSR
jgi:hydrogenase maturation factor